MDSDLRGEDIVFSQRLASGEPLIRQRAFRLLQDFVNKNSIKKSKILKLI